MTQYCKTFSLGIALLFLFQTGAIDPIAIEPEIKNGDLIFQTSLSSQSKAVQLATKSVYSHCGIIFKEGNKFYVFEAVQPVNAHY